MDLCMDLLIGQTVIIEELIEKIGPFNISAEKIQEQLFLLETLSALIR